MGSMQLRFIHNTGTKRCTKIISHKMLLFEYLHDNFELCKLNIMENIVPFSLFDELVSTNNLEQIIKIRLCLW